MMSCSHATASLTGTEDGGEPILSNCCERQRRGNAPSRERQYRHLGERRAQDSGARLKGSGRRSGKKRPARVKARRSLVLLQPQLEQKIAEVATRSSRRCGGRRQRSARNVTSPRLSVQKRRALPREFVLGGLSRWEETSSSCR
ncbi:unnamed protein product [Ectocarpus sp. CCAP 1310/34]|nr:unnamed protein product [Ectocarpus sp. CCAP 1310/34]